MLDVTFWSAVRLSEHLSAGSLSPVDIVDTFLARIMTADPRLRAFTEVFAQEAREAARRAAGAIGPNRRAGPLHGMPVAFKDLIEVRGHVTSAGSRTWSDRRSYATATVARKLLAHGCILLGKTHTAEFAMGGWGLNQHLGTPVNPWDLSVHRVPGGSSSGSAVAVAARLVPWAIGTDTGGSVRLPAAWCGVTGLKPSKGRVSTHGVVPLSPTLDTVGPIARSVDDVALLFSLISGPDPLDPSTLRVPQADVLAGLRQGIAGMRIGRLTNAELDGTDPATRAAYEAAVVKFGELGACVVPVTLPRPLDAFARQSVILLVEAYALYGELAADPDLPMDEFVRGRVLAGRDIRHADYTAGLRELRDARTQFGGVFDQVSALLTPTTETTAPAIDAIDRRRPPTRFTRCASMLNLAALALPNGCCGQGLPTSLQILCREFDEATALRIGWSFQNATGWHERVPPAAAPPARPTDQPGSDVNATN
jgi:aspartyl-tRNA(Asn)/glutamyl-tRNA(Gln) amidotransferase subunit A